MTAAHRGIFGLGLLLTLGMVATLGVSLIVLPVMLVWTERLKSIAPVVVGRRSPESRDAA
jgi:predicted RND superfamily exporter protein